MSHFVVLALVDRKTKNTMKALEKAIEPLLAPYDENTQVEPYLRRCYCVGKGAESAVEKQVAEKYGKWGDLRDSFGKRKDVIALRKEDFDLNRKWHEEKAEISKDDKKALEKRIHDVDGKLDQLWKAHSHYEEREALEAKLLAEHPDKDKPKAKCDECKGNGEKTSTYNPKSKWDWYCIGGRWTAYLDFSDYDPVKDPDNYEVCFLCAGTGKRDDKLGREERAKDPTYTCNGCSGKGKALKWSLKPVGYAMPVSEILAHIEKDPERNLVPFAIVTPDGWFERGKMGWFAAVHDEKKAETWEKEAVDVLKKYKDRVAVVVDCHI